MHKSSGCNSGAIVPGQYLLHLSQLVLFTRAMAVATRDTFNLFVQCIGKVPDPSLSALMLIIAQCPSLLVHI